MRGRGRIPILLLALALAWAPGTGSAAEDRAPDGPPSAVAPSDDAVLPTDVPPPALPPGGAICDGRLGLEVHERFRTIWLSPFEVDAEGRDHGQSLVGEHRLRLRPWVSFGRRVRIRGEADLFDGQVFGDTTTVGASSLRRPRDRLDGLYRFVPRALWIDWRARFGRLFVGQMPVRWGLGMVLNDGRERGQAFGDRRHGDLVERIALELAPLAIARDTGAARRFRLLFALDVVYDDEHARLLEGDVAVRGLLGFLYRAPDWSAGLLGAYRHQDDDGGGELREGLVDVYARLRVPFSGAALRFAVEAALVVGEAVRAGSPEGDGVALFAFGAVARMSLDWPDAGLFPALEVGFASGDGDPRDGFARAFTFDPDHRVGLVLFEQVLGRTTARTADRAALAGREAPAPARAPWAPSEGAVTNAFYASTTLVHRPARWIDMKIGVLYALAPSGFGDPVPDADTGRTPLGGDDGGVSLGLEVDAGVLFTLFARGLFTVRLGVEGGALLPFGALGRAGGDPTRVYLARGTMDALW